MSITLAPEAGRILISEPFLDDFYFKRAVVLLAEHNKDGSVGLVLNKTTDLKLSEIVASTEHNIPEEFDNYVFIGGPVKTDSLFFLYTRNDVLEDSLKIIEGIYWGGKIADLAELMQKRIIKPNEIRFFAGYSGWEPLQLNIELEEHSWVVANAKADFLLKNTPETLWKKSVLNLGGDYTEWISYPVDPHLN